MEKSNRNYYSSKKWSIVLAAFIFCLFFIISCNNKNYIYEESEEIIEGKWLYKDTLNYTFQITDTTKIYNIYLELAHSTDYTYQNLYLKLHTQFPTGKRIEQQVSFELADKYGQWYGDCGNSSCSLLVPSQKGAYFNTLGKHTITIEQFMRKDPIEGIKKISVRIEDTGVSR